MVFMVFFFTWPSFKVTWHPIRLVIFKLPDLRYQTLILRKIGKQNLLHQNQQKSHQRQTQDEKLSQTTEKWRTAPFRRILAIFGKAIDYGMSKAWTWVTSFCWCWSSWSSWICSVERWRWICKNQEWIHCCNFREVQRCCNKEKSMWVTNSWHPYRKSFRQKWLFLGTTKCTAKVIIWIFAPKNDVSLCTKLQNKVSDMIAEKKHSI